MIKCSYICHSIENQSNMEYTIIYTTTEPNEMITAIAIHPTLHPSLLKQRFPNVQHLKINFHTERTDVSQFQYLEALNEAFTLESFCLKGYFRASLPANLWTKQLKTIVLDFKNLYNVIIEPPIDFENHLERIEISNAFSVSSRLFATHTLRHLSLTRVSFGLAGIGFARQLQGLTLIECKDEIYDFKPTDLVPCLKGLEMKDCPQIRLPKEILISESFQYLKYDFPLYPNEYYYSRHLSYDFLNLFKYFPISLEERLMIGQIWLEGLDRVKDWSKTGESFLKLVNLNPLIPILKQFIYENLYFLNPNQQKEVNYTDFRGKTIHFVGDLSSHKQVYKQRLSTIGIHYHTTLRVDTDFIVIGDAVTNFPTFFWNYPHYFWSESDLIAFLKIQQPGFLEDADAPSQTAALSALLLSGMPENDRLAVELLKTGGIPTECLPDLLLIAKVSTDESVKTNLKKMIKPLLSEQAKKLLAYNQALRGDKYQALAPDFDVPRMLYCSYKRKNNKYDLMSYFWLRQSLNHRNRSEMFEIACRQSDFYSGNYDLNLGISYFTNDEIKVILNLPRYYQRLNSFHFICLEPTLPDELFTHINIRSLSVQWWGETLPEAISQLKWLLTLSLTNPELKTLPISVLDIPHLSELKLVVSKKFQLPPALQALETHLDRFDIELISNKKSKASNSMDVRPKWA